MSTTMRADITSGFGTMMAAYIAANPTLLQRHFNVRVESEKDIPMTYLDRQGEQVTFSNGVRVRTARVDLVLVSRLTEAGETAALHDITVDSLLEWLTLYPHVGGSSTVWDELTIADEAAGTDNQFFATRFGFTISDGAGRG